MRDHADERAILDLPENPLTPWDEWRNPPNLANRVEWMYKQSSETYESAKSASDPDTQFKALQRLEKHVEMQAKIVGLIRAEKSGEIDLTNFMTQYNKVMAAVRVAAASGSPEMKELLAKFHDLATEFEKQGL